MHCRHVFQVELHGRRRIERHMEGDVIPLEGRGEEWEWEEEKGNYLGSEDVDAHCV